MKGKCVNKSEHPIYVYGPRNGSSGTVYETGLYMLLGKKSTQSGWDCDGLYITPGQRIRQFSRTMISGPAALKFLDSQTFVINVEHDEEGWFYTIDTFNVGVFYPFEVSCPSDRIPPYHNVCWLIPETMEQLNKTKGLLAAPQN